jgi:hypothetical protein
MPGVRPPTRGRRRKETIPLDHFARAYPSMFSSFEANRCNRFFSKKMDCIKFDLMQMMFDAVFLGFYRKREQ